jgi:hypothetical protein
MAVGSPNFQRGAHLENEQNVTKNEALNIVMQHMDKPGVMGLETLIELLTWQTKLALWLLQDKAKAA